ncbi:MAG: hypothetical protein ACETWR_00395 [Anaerolineae bacterium]
MSGKPICANCGIEIRWRPTIVDGVAYCCLGCSRGGPCECDYSRLPRTNDHTAIVPFVIPAHAPSSRKNEQIKKKG